MHASIEAMEVAVLDDPKDVRQYWHWLWERVDPLVALILAGVCMILGIIGIVTSSVLASAILGILTLLAFTLVRDRSQRDRVERELQRPADGTSRVSADVLFGHGTKEISVLGGTERDLWLVQETGTLIAQDYHKQV